MARTPSQTCVLAINGGSSSIRFVLHQAGEALEHRLHRRLTATPFHQMVNHESVATDPLNIDLLAFSET